MDKHESPRFLFIINPGSGNNTVDWPSAIDAFFSELPFYIEKHFIETGCNTGTIKDKIIAAAPD